MIEPCVRDVPEPLDGTHFVFLNAHELCAAYVAGTRRVRGLAPPASTAVLSTFYYDQTIERVDASTLRFRVPAGLQSIHNDRSSRPGTAVGLPGSTQPGLGFVVTVTSHNADGWVDGFDVRFSRPLTQYAFRCFEDAQMKPWNPEERPRLRVYGILPSLGL